MSTFGNLTYLNKKEYTTAMKQLKTQGLQDSAVATDLTLQYKIREALISGDNQQAEVLRTQRQENYSELDEFLNDENYIQNGLGIEIGKNKKISYKSDGLETDSNEDIIISQTNGSETINTSIDMDNSSFGSQSTSTKRKPELSDQQKTIDAQIDKAFGENKSVTNIYTDADISTEKGGKEYTQDIKKGESISLSKEDTKFLNQMGLLKADDAPGSPGFDLDKEKIAALGEKDLENLSEDQKKLLKKVGNVANGLRPDGTDADSEPKQKAENIKEQLAEKIMDKLPKMMEENPAMALFAMKMLESLTPSEEAQNTTQSNYIRPPKEERRMSFVEGSAQIGAGFQKVMTAGAMFTQAFGPQNYMQIQRAQVNQYNMLNNYASSATAPNTTSTSATTSTQQTPIKEFTGLTNPLDNMNPYGDPYKKFLPS